VSPITTTVIVATSVQDCGLSSVTVKVTLKVPGLLKIFAAVVPVAVLPSAKSQS
jgi:hypothetical protein